MKSNENRDLDQLWMLTGEADEYFRKLGGSGRYPGFAEWHVPALILLLLSGVDPRQGGFLESQDSHEISARLWRETDGLPRSLAVKLDGVVIAQETFEQYLKRSFTHLSRVSTAGELLEWSRFLGQNRTRFARLV